MTETTNTYEEIRFNAIVRITSDHYPDAPEGYVFTNVMPWADGKKCYVYMKRADDDSTIR